jgi:hypothetical protein
MPTYKVMSELFYSFHSEFEAIVMDTVGDKIKPYLLDRIFEDFDNLQEKYHSRLRTICREDGEENEE